MPSNTILIFIIVGVIMIAFVFLGNIIIIHLLIRKAIKYNIKPQLASKGCIYVDYKWPGLFSYGDFKYFNTGFTTFSGSGNNRIAIYSYMFYLDETQKVSNRITVKIDVRGFRIENVKYSSEV